MKISDLQSGQINVLEVQPVGVESFGPDLRPGSEVRILRGLYPEEAILEMAGRTWSVRGADPRHQTVLTSMTERALPRLCWVVNVFPAIGDATHLVVQTHTFTMQYSLSDPLVMGISDKLLEQIRSKYARSIHSAEQAITWLADKALISPLHSPRALVSAGTRLRFESAAFRIHGNAIAIDVADGVITRIVRSQLVGDDGRQPVILIEGSISFADLTAVGQFVTLGKTELDTIVRQTDSYLNLWKEYNSIERQNLLQRARDFRWLRYSRCTPLADGLWRFYVTKDEQTRRTLDLLRDREEISLEIDTQLPGELQDNAGDGSSDPNPRSRQVGSPFAGECVNVNDRDGALDIRPINPDEDAKPPASGIIYLALTGDRVRLRRREEARDLILSQECSIPWLGLLLENRPAPIRKLGSLELPGATRLRELFGGDQPTDNQIKALEIALNTPDIALIQGPPGTGKTKTIVAIETYLAEIADKMKTVAGRILLTSYQHDAVENAASKTLVFDLPAVKVGRRKGEDEIADGVRAWKEERIAKLTVDLPEPPVSSVLKRVREIQRGYALAPGTPAEIIQTLVEVFDLVQFWVPPDISDQLFALVQRLRQGQVASLSAGSEDNDLLLRAIHGLRTEEAGFSDDGPHNAYKLMKRLSTTTLLTVEGHDLALLEKASQWDQDSIPEFLPALADLKRKLQDALIPTRTQQLNSPQPNADVELLLTSICEQLYERIRQGLDGVDATRYEYLTDLRNDDFGVRATLREYTAVLAATCQQSVGRAMQYLKDDVHGLRFESVIIDEAARANPLDLLIPMSRAERRIVLVGDHRQLPHILDPDVERDLSVSSKSTQDLLSKSLFERLFRHLQDLEKRDGISRTVTLNAQYRMHPILGKFVSDTFYSPFGEAFRSPKPAEQFSHRLEEPYRNCVAAWVDVSPAKGEERGGRSKFRPAEAKWIANEVKRLMEQHSGISFGVITFYKSQEQELLRCMEPLGLAEEDGGILKISRRWREGINQAGRAFERLRVGTVDAFQGKEFDIVFLSMTRCNTRAATDEQSARRKYGFLTLENRLCVAMSRQTRLLVVVGAQKMLEETAAAQYVRGLVKFKELCEGPHGITI